MSKIEWINFNSQCQIDEINQESIDKMVVIFKHSIRCSISDVALSRLERSWDNNVITETKTYLLDLINHREISNKIASFYGIKHESPQILVIRNMECIYQNSHLRITFEDLIKNLN